MWDLIVLVPDYCLSVYLSIPINKTLQQRNKLWIKNLKIKDEDSTETKYGGT